MRIDCTLQIDDSGKRVVFYGYVDRLMDNNGDGDYYDVDDTIIPDSPAKMSFSSHFSDIRMQVSEADEPNTQYEIVYYDYEKNSGIFGSFYDNYDTNSSDIYSIEQIITDQNNSITFKMLTDETEGADLSADKYDAIKGLLIFFTIMVR